MKKNFTLIFTMLLCLFWSKGESQTQFWSDTFEDSGAPSSGTRTPSYNQGGPSVPYAYYFLRTDGSDIALQTPFAPETATSYQNVQGSKFWAGEDTDKVGTGVNNAADKIQNITWSGINISGKTGLTFKGLFACNNSIDWQNYDFGTTYDFMEVEYRVDGGAWILAGGLYPDASNTIYGRFREDTNGDKIGDGSVLLSRTFQEFGWSISGTGTTLDLRFKVSADASLTQEFAIDNFRLFEAPSCTNPTVSSNPPNRAICNGNNTTFSITATGATAYQWQVNTGSGFTDITNGGVYSNATTNTLNITGATAGMNGYLYRCVAKDGSCSTTSSSGTLSVSSISTASGAQSNVSCFGGSNGAAAVTPSGGISPYTYSWSPSGGTGSIATGLSAGTYTVTITDNIGCTATRNYTITQPTALAASAASQTNVACNGGATGAASVSVSGGTSGYSYNWTPGNPTGDGTNSVTGLTAGTWTCTVTDANACTTSVNFTITQPPALSLSAASQTNVSCNGGSNGAASVNVATGGAGGYTYNWTPGNPVGDGTTSVSGLTAGTWTCTVTDANACTTSVNFTITQPPALSLSAASQTNVSCNGGSNGAASVNTPTGGAGGYTYNWTPGNPTGDGTNSVTGLTAGTWTCTVTDANACTTSQTFTITQPTAISLTAASQTNVSCNGGSNGAASVNTPTGGTGGYTYNWTPGNPTGDGTTSVTGLTPGTWTCTVTDANSCTTSVNFTITQPPALSLTAASQTNVSCNGGSNGAASVNTPTGGAGGYTYNWTPGNPTGDGTNSVTGLTAGTWTCTVTDANACTTSVNFTITQPPALSLSAASQTNVSCNGGSNGAASVNTPTGGAGGYTYNWTPGNPTGDGTNSVTGLTAGTWTCTVTDANACTTSVNFTVTQPSAISLTASSQTNIACNGGATGAATVNAATGGAGGYTYNWTPGNPTGDGTTSVTGLTAGTWTCTVTDANACTASQTFTVTQPSALNATAASQTNVSCNGGANGSATVSVSGGTSGYTYSWSPSGGTAATATGLAAGTYTVTVTDANACQATQSFTITQPSALNATAASQTNVSCNGGTNGSATVSVSGGTSGYTYSWSPSGGTAATATGLSAGTYTVTVTDANLCQTTQSFTITQPTALVATAASQTNVSCNGGTNGSATVSVSGGTSGYTYSWSPSGGTAATATGLSAGTYTVTVTDANLCQTTQSFTITQPTALVATAASQTNVSCNGGTNGSATVSVSGGTSGYTYSWSPSGGTAATATGLSAGTYTVTVTDANSCQTTQMFTITEPTAIGFTTTTLSGYDYNTSYSQTIASTGGTGPKTYAVTAGDLPSGFTLSSSGQITGASTQVADSNFTVTVTDANACTATHSYTLKLNQIPITVTADASQTKVYGASDPVFTYTVTPTLLSGDSFTGGLTRVTGENIGSYEITQGTLSAGDKYLITYVSKDFVITAKPITVTADAAQTKVYGTVDPAFTYSVSPSLVSGDSFTGTLTRVAGENIGAYAINQGSLSAGSNYDITYVSKDFTITAKSITVTADVSQTKVYGTVDPTFTYSVSPALVSGDTFTGTLTRDAGENIGNYAITQGTLSAGNNYDIIYVSKDFIITAKPITITADVSQTKVYGTVDPTFTYTVSPGLVSGDSFTGTLSRVSGEDVGIYVITQGSLTAGSNYDITYNSKDFTITAKPIIVTADVSQTKVYGTVDPTFTYSVSPALVSGDSFTGALSRVSGENVGLYAITQGTLTAGGNYTISFVSKDFSITKANQTISWNQILDLGCETGSSVVLTAETSSGLPINYTSSNTNIATISDGELSVHDYGFTTITASQEGNNNYFPASSVTLTVVNRQPNLIRKQFENVIFFDNSSQQFASYTWYKDGALVSGQTLQYYKENGTLNGIYYAKATRLDGMVVTTCPLVLSSTVEDEYIKIAPNPVKPNASYELLTNVSSARLQNAHVEVYSVGGILMQDKMTNENVVTLTAPLVEGIYVVKMTLSNGKIFTKNLLVRN